MRVVKDSIYRDIPDNRAAEYAAKGYAPVESEKGKASPFFDSMTIAQLAEYALERGIDLAGAKKKADMIACIVGSSTDVVDEAGDSLEEGE